MMLSLDVAAKVTHGLGELYVAESVTLLGNLVDDAPADYKLKEMFRPKTCRWGHDAPSFRREGVILLFRLAAIKC